MSRLAWWLLPCVLLAIAARPERPALIRDVPYSAARDDQRTLDLYLPDAEHPPLLAFVHSQFWSRNDHGRELHLAFAKPLQDAGVAVAVIRHRLAPEHRHPEPAEDVAAAVAWLFANADRYGWDPEQIYLSGHSSGAHLASLVALDRSYLAAHQLDPGALAGVIPISGVYDLDPPDGVASPEEIELYEAAFGGGRARRAASPIRHVRPDAPPFLILGATGDIPGYVPEAQRFAEALRASGHPKAEAWFAPGRNHLSVLDVRSSDGASHMYLWDELGIEPMPEHLQDLITGTGFWRDPPLSTEGFWEHEDLVKSRDVDERLRDAVRLLFVGLNRNLSKTWDAERYHAIDLFDWLDALGPERTGRGPWLTLTNARRQKIFWELERIRPYEPVIVVGIDDERNLFRIRDIQKAKRMYSWIDGPPPPAVAGPLGGFIFFRREPPEEFTPSMLVSYALTPDSFTLSDDPLVPLRDLPPEMFTTVTWEYGCIYCHTFRGVGGAAGHLRFRDGARIGGLALPLEQYPEKVWWRFVYDQKQVASEIGASMNPVPASRHDELFALIEAERTGPPGVE